MGVSKIRDSNIVPEKSRILINKADFRLVEPFEADFRLVEPLQLVSSDD